MKIYLAARFANKALLQLVKFKWEPKYEITSRWLSGDPAEKTDIAVTDFQDVSAADVLVLYVDGVKSTGAWVEFGMAYALGKEIIIIGEYHTETVFKHLPDLHKALTWEVAETMLEEIAKENGWDSPEP